LFSDITSETSEKVQELDQKMKTIFGDPQSSDPESSYVPQNQLSALRGIYYNTTVLTKQQQALVNISSESLKSIATGLGTALGKVDLTALGEAAQRNYGEAVKFVKENSASSILGRLGDFISKQTEEGFSRGNVLAKSGYSKVSSSASSIFKTLNKFRDNIKLKALETFDVYVKDEKEPRMINLKIRNDRYLDFSNDLKPIKTRDEIKKIEIVKYVDDNGSDVKIGEITQNEVCVDKFVTQTFSRRLAYKIGKTVNAVKYDGKFDIRIFEI
jgi:hypothetical protein